jgi:Domain of unknown function (DUF4153)
MNISSLKANPRLLIALSAALIQGLALFALHKAVDHEAWAKAHLGLLVLAYAVVVVVPLTIQLLSEHWQKPLLWRLTIGIGVLYALLGWHFGSRVAVPTEHSVVQQDDAFIFTLSAGVLWALAVPFLSCRLSLGRWRCEYAQLFAAAWQSALRLAEAAAFTGAFWLLLGLWQQLFVMLGYYFFNNLFEKPAFVYPVTCVTFGIALYLTGSIERLVTVIREQILGLLKWLTPVAALILALFAPTLLFKLPDLLFHGERAIKAQWLLWILAMTVLLLNAGYQNGTAERPYPKVLQAALRVVVPTTVIVAATAFYSLMVRIGEYGITVGRVYGLIVAIVALGYSAGYTWAACRRGPWLKGIERVNVAVALGLMVILILILTPIASPYRFAANDQAARLTADASRQSQNDLRYLRWDAGQYGIEALKRLAEGRDGKMPEWLATGAKEMLASTNRYEALRDRSLEKRVADMVVFPTGSKIDPQLAEIIRGRSFRASDHSNAMELMAVMVDLNGDAVDECVVFFETDVVLYTQNHGTWSKVLSGWDGSLREPDFRKKLRQSLEAKDFAPQSRAWSDLRAGSAVFQFNSR